MSWVRFHSTETDGIERLVPRTAWRERALDECTLVRRGASTWDRKLRYERRKVHVMGCRSRVANPAERDVGMKTPLLPGKTEGCQLPFDRLLETVEPVCGLHAEPDDADASVMGRLPSRSYRT